MIKLTKRGTGTRARASRFLPVGLLAGPAGSIATALLSNWKIAVFAILLGIIGYQNFMSFEILKPFGLRTVPGILQDYERDLSVANEQLKECEIGRELLKQTIADTNAQIQEWVDLSMQQQENLNKLGNTLMELKEESKAEIEVIIQGPIPQTCEGAIKFLKDAATKGELRWEK